MPEYAYDISLAAVVRVTAPDEPAARKAMRDCLDCVALDIVRDANEDQPSDVRITEASISPDNSAYKDGAILFEIDGEDYTGDET